MAYITFDAANIVFLYVENFILPDEICMYSLMGWLFLSVPVTNANILFLHEIVDILSKKRISTISFLCLLNISHVQENVSHTGWSSRTLADILGETVSILYCMYRRTKRHWFSAYHAVRHYGLNSAPKYRQSRIKNRPKTSHKTNGGKIRQKLS